MKATDGIFILKLGAKKGAKQEEKGKKGANYWVEMVSYGNNLN
ncbi:hypothetical protein [Pectobacterium sp. B1J-3]